LGGDLRVKRARWIICSRKLEIDNDIGLFVVPYCLWGNREPGNEMQTWFL